MFPLLRGFFGDWWQPVCGSCTKTMSKNFSGIIHLFSKYLEHAFVAFLCTYNFCILAMIRKYCSFPSCLGKERKDLHTCREVCDPVCMVGGTCIDFCSSWNYVVGELIKYIMLRHFSLLTSQRAATICRQISSMVRSRPNRRHKF